MKIRVLEDDTGFAPAAERFNAIDDESYDGENALGTGATPDEAIADLLEKLDRLWFSA